MSELTLIAGGVGSVEEVHRWTEVAVEAPRKVSQIASRMSDSNGNTCFMN